MYYIHILSFICVGAEKYVRSALRGLCGAFPDACLVVHRIPHPSSSTDQNEVNGTKRTISNHCSNVFSNHQSSSIKEKQLLGTKVRNEFSDQVS